uniref:Uncharacterized protein n=1 Tax=Romanomermis culicivorax TaxID=13658 RepID=A0A915JGT9_ROMCU
MEQEKPVEVIIADPLIANIPANDNKNVIEEEKLMEIVQPESEIQPDDKKDPEPKYANIQVWKRETDNTDPCICFWEVIDRKKAHDLV